MVTFIQNIGLAFVYYMSALVCVTFFSHDGIAYFLWLPAGFALFGVLQVGYRVLPGLFVGAVGAQYITTINYLLDGIDHYDMVLMGFVAVRSVGVMLQACFSAFLLKRFLRFPSSIEDSKSVFLIFFLGGAVGCLVSAFVGVTSLYFQGIISVDNIPISYMAWWIGDAFGVCLVTAPMLILFQTRENISRQRKIIVFVPILSAIILFAIAEQHIAQSERELKLSELKNQSNHLTAGVEAELLKLDSILGSLKSFYRSSNFVDAKEFREYVAPYFKKAEYLHGIAWAPYIHENNKQDFLARMRKHNPDYKIFNYDGIFWDGKQDAFPIAYLEPATQNSYAHGFNIGSEPIRQSTIVQSILSNKGLITSPTTMIANSGVADHNRAFVYSYPLFDPRVPQNIYGSLHGVFVMVFSAQEFFEGLQEMLDKQSLYLEVRDTETRKVLFHSKLKGNTLNENCTYSLQFKAAGRLWDLKYTAMDNKNAEVFLLPGSILSGNLVIAFLVFLLSVVTGQTSLTEKIVWRRTQQLDENRQRLQLALEGVQDGVWDWEIETGNCYFSETFKKLIGYEGKEFPSKIESWFVLLSEDTQKYLRTKLEIHHREKGLYFVEYPMRCYSGEIRWFEVKANSVWNEEGHQVRMVGSIRDITDRREIQDQLIQEKENNDYILKRNPALVVGLDSEGQIIFVNSRVCELTGYDEGSLVGYNWWTLMFPGNEYQQVDAISNLLETYDELVDHEMILTAQDSRKLTITWNSQNKFNDDNEIEQIVLFGLDLTELLEFQDKLIDAKEDADKANRTKSEFLANMSHEIRTPMNGIIGTASLLEETKLDPGQAKYVKIIQDSGRVLLQIINEILDYSKIESGFFEISKDHIFNPKELLDRQYQLLLPLANEKGLDFKIEMDDNIPDVVKGDDTRLAQVLINILNNALKFTDEGEVALSAQVSKEDPYFVRYDIIDTGPGISNKDQHKIFETFGQAEEFKTKKKEGTGLGLPISKYLVEEMGGEIGFESVEGAGTRFWFTIQFDKPTEKDLFMQKDDKGDLDIESLKRELKDKRILLVEDVITNRFVLKEMLSEMRVALDLAENGEVAVQKVKENEYDLILMDCQMPVMDGFEATKIIRDLGYRDLSIVALTANALEEDREKCLKAGMDDFVSKPVEKNELITSIVENIFREGKRGKVT